MQIWDTCVDSAALSLKDWKFNEEVQWDGIMGIVRSSVLSLTNACDEYQDILAST